MRTMKKHFTLATLAMVAIVACNKEIETLEDGSIQSTKKGDVTLVAEAPLETKTMVDGLNVKWATGDHIAVFDESKAKHDFSLATGAGQTTATFTGSMGGNDEVGYAVYPYSANASITDDPYFTVDYADSYAYNAVTVPMWGEKSAGKYAFDHIGGAFKFSYTNVPDAAYSFFFESTADDVTGTAMFDGTDSVIADNEGNSVMVTDLPSSSNLDFIIPVPAAAAGSDYSFTVSLLDNNLDPIPGSVKAVTSAKTVQLGHLKPLKAIDLKAAKDEVLWSEDYTGYAANAVPTSGTGWRETAVTYTNTNTKVQSDNYAGGAKPELMITGPGSVTVSNIPAAGWTSLAVSYRRNNNPITVASTVATSIGAELTGSGICTREITLPAGTVTFDLTFSSSVNARLDDLCVTAGAPEAGIGVVTLDATATSVSGATLNGKINLLRGATIGNVTSAGFKYKKVGAAEYTTVPEASIAESISESITGLEANADYVYHAFAVYDSGDEVDGNEIEFTAAPPKYITITASTTNVPGSYAAAQDKTLEGYSFKVTQMYATGGKLQWKKNDGSLYNNDTFPGDIKTIIIVYNSSDANKNFTVNVGADANPSSGTSITPSIASDGLTYTFDCSSGSYDYFLLKNGSGAGYLDSVKIVWK